MMLAIELPAEFEEAFNTDRFQDELARLSSDIRSRQLGGYDWQFIDALRKALNDADIVYRPNVRPDIEVINRNCYISTSSSLHLRSISCTPSSAVFYSNSTRNYVNYIDVTIDGYIGS